MQDCGNVGFMGCMRQNYMRYIRWASLMVVLVLLSACMVDKAVETLPAEDWSYADPGKQNNLAIGTVRSQNGVRFIRLDEKSCSQVMNPQEIASLPARAATRWLSRSARATEHTSSLRSSAHVTRRRANSFRPPWHSMYWTLSWSNSRASRSFSTARPAYRRSM